MKKLLISALFFTFSATAGIHPGIMDSAQNICNGDSECINVIALELDNSYSDGVNTKNKNIPLDIAMKSKIDNLSGLCDMAPDANLCSYYKNQLLREFYLGYKS